MLNISNISITENINTDNFSAFQTVRQFHFSRILAYWLIGGMILLIAVLFVPWTQNVQGKEKLRL
jgi:hypothetical protein